MAKDQLHTPIYVNLDGAYHIPVSGEKPKAGSITGDLRLASLDAFLMSLNSALQSPKAGQSSTLVDALKIVIDKCAVNKPKHSDLTLAITSKMNPESHEITYNFNVLSKDSS